MENVFNFSQFPKLGILSTGLFAITSCIDHDVHSYIETTRGKFSIVQLDTSKYNQEDLEKVAKHIMEHGTIENIDPNNMRVIDSAHGISLTIMNLRTVDDEVSVKNIKTLDDKKLYCYPFDGNFSSEERKVGSESISFIANELRKEEKKAKEDAESDSDSSGVHMIIFNLEDGSKGK